MDGKKGMANGNGFFDVKSEIMKIDGWMHEIELEWLYNTASKLPRNSLIVEIGAWMGRSSGALATGANNERYVVSVDTWKGSPDEPGHNIAKTEDVFQIYQGNLKNIGIVPQNYLEKSEDNGYFYLQGDSVECSKYFEDKSIDWIFIDGWHTGFARDIDAYMPKMKDDSIISGHDYFCFYNEIQQEIHKRFYIHQVIHSIWVKSMNNNKFPDWY